MTATTGNIRLTIPLENVGIHDVAVVGGKNASLGEMVGKLAGQGIRVPHGFATTADAYWHLLDSSGLRELIRDCLHGIQVEDVADLQRRGARIRQAIVETPLPDDLREAIVLAYRALHKAHGGSGLLPVAVRSSATAEDLPDASFAGQQETYLNVIGEAALCRACQDCFASLFTDRAISYRIHRGYDHFQVALSIGVQQMVAADRGSSGVIFTVDTESGFADAVLINAAWGLGENVVKGTVNPDEFVVFKQTLHGDLRPILKKKMGGKQMRMIGGLADQQQATRNVPVPQAEQNIFCLTDDEILQLARWAIKIEAHYSDCYQRPTPMDIEFAKDGDTGQLFILQARPETVQSQATPHTLQQYRLLHSGPSLVTGSAVGQRIGSGAVRIIEHADRLQEFQPGEVLVATKTDPDWEPVMKKASAIVTDHGGRTCHAAIVARELGLPAIVGTRNATHVLSDGRTVTVCCAEGDTGHVYDGQLGFTIDEVDLQTIPKTQTRVMVNIANPGQAFTVAALPLDGVGLARLEFVISGAVRVHPQALLHFEQLDPVLRQEIADVTVGYDDKVHYFIDRLAEGVAMIAAAFYPRPVIVRFSDFKSNEYANLIGGQQYEIAEENPMLGFRGASRYCDPLYRDCFALECRAMKKVRDEMGLQNVKLMIPFCRTVQEGQQVIAAMAKHGLVRGQQDLQVYVMCEIPANVLLAQQFAEVFDGFSIGSNDLTQLTLGVDRDCELVAKVFDERNPAVLKMIEMAIAGAKAADRPIGICGQAPSDFPEITRFLVNQGIDSISVTPDVALKTRLLVAEAESQRAGSQSEISPGSASM